MARSNCMALTGALSILVLLFVPGFKAHAAEYNGQVIDGQLFDGTAQQVDSDRTYDVQIVFEGDQAYVTFPDGTQRTILIAEEIEDPRQIIGSDEDNVGWSLDVHGLK